MRKKIGIFDFDHNILNTEDRLFLEKYENGQRVKKKIYSYEEFQQCLIDGDQYRLLDDNGSFEYYYDESPISLKQQIRDTLDRPGLSFQKFLITLQHAGSYAIVTGRGHSVENLKNITRIFISDVLSANDRMELVEKYRAEIKDLFLGPEKIIQQYIDSQGYYGVNNNDFVMKFQCGNGTSTSFKKKVAIEHYLSLIHEKYGMCEMSIGFSDDQEQNIQEIKNFFESVKHTYPHTHFVVYHAQKNSGQLDKYRITKKPHHL